MSLDFSQFKSLTIDGISLKQLFINGIRVFGGYKNWVRYSLESDGITIYNDGLGYKNQYRVRSGGAEISYGGSACTGFIPVKGGDIIRLTGWDFSYPQNGNAINVSDSSRTNIGQFTMLPAAYGILHNEKGAYAAYHHVSVVKEKDGVWKWVVPPAESGVAYIRITGWCSEDGSKLIVTINEEIT